MDTENITEMCFDFLFPALFNLMHYKTDLFAQISISFKCKFKCHHLWSYGAQRWILQKMQNSFHCQVLRTRSFFEDNRFDSFYLEKSAQDVTVMALRKEWRISLRKFHCMVLSVPPDSRNKTWKRNRLFFLVGQNSVSPSCY